MNAITVVVEYMNKPGPTDFKGIFNKLDIRYKEVSLGRVSGYLAYKNNQFIVGVNSELTVQKRRFAAAHQLAHYILHRDLFVSAGECRHEDIHWPGGEMDSYPLTNHHDRQANHLALQILLPLSKLNRLVSSGIEDSKDLMRHFGVSEKLMQLRLETLTS